MRSFYRTAEVLIFLWIYPLIEISENSLSRYILKQNQLAPFPLTQTFQPRSFLHFIAYTLDLKLIKAQYQLKKRTTRFAKHKSFFNPLPTAVTTIIHYSSFIIFTTAPQRLSHLL